MQISCHVILQDSAYNQTAMQTCNICVSDVKSLIACKWCNEEACATCLKTYFLSKPEANCMFPKCGKVLDNYFIWQNFTKTFFERDYMNHRAQVILQEERAKLPETQLLITHMKKMQEGIVINKKDLFLDDMYDGITAFIRKLIRTKKLDETEYVRGFLRNPNAHRGEFVRIMIYNLDNRYYECSNYIDNWWNPPETHACVRIYIDSMLNKGAKNYRIFRQYFKPDHYMITIHYAYANYMNKSSGKRISHEDIKSSFSCEKENCNGIVQRNQCGICNSAYCDKCGRPKNDDHICNKDEIASFKSLKSETKPCPSCYTRIFKIDGCDQMWCTKCQVTFSWDTGEKVKGRIHNPHYFEYLRNNKIAIPRAPGDPCGEVVVTRDNPLHFYAHDFAISLRSMEETDNLPKKLLDYRYRYLMGNIDDRRWRILVKAAHKANNKRCECNSVIDTLETGIMDIISLNLPSYEFKRQLLALIDFYNESMMEIGKRYKNKVRFLINNENVNKYSLRDKIFKILEDDNIMFMFSDDKSLSSVDLTHNPDGVELSIHEKRNIVKHIIKIRKKLDTDFLNMCKKNDISLIVHQFDLYEIFNKLVKSKINLLIITKFYPDFIYPVSQSDLKCTRALIFRFFKYVKSRKDLRNEMVKFIMLTALTGDSELLEHIQACGLFGK